MQRNANMLKILKKVRFCRLYWFLCNNTVLWGLASQDEGTEALYAMLITKAEYIATDSIASDSLIQGAVKYYNKESDNSEMILE